MLAFSCPHCRHRLKVKEKAAGRRIRCPRCAQPIAIPAPVAAPAPPGGSDAPTVPPAQPSPAPHAETQSNADPAGGPSLTEAPASTAWRQELLAFLAPAQGPGEIGRLGTYRILKVLGTGGMGVVFQAEDPDLRRLVALKAMLPALASSATARDRFLREARAAAAIEHDHIVAIYQVGEDRGIPFLAMKFLQGESLDQRLARTPRLSPAEVLRIGRETATGLAAAHKRGLIHRDIKPANLWLEAESGRVKILDFGLARTADDDTHLTQQGAILGTPAYMAPEQASGRTIDARTDLFSLGCVLYRLCTGRLPFQARDMVGMLVEVATAQPTPPHALQPQVPVELSDLVMSLLAKKREQRPPSAQALVEMIRKLERDLIRPKPPRRPAKPSPARPAAKPPAGPAPRRRLGWLAAVIVAIVLLGAGAYLAWHWETPSTEAPPPSIVHVFNHSDLSNFYPYLGTPRGSKAPLGRDNDPEQVFSVQDGMLRISGQIPGCLCTREEYANYRLIVEYKWGSKTWPPRERRARSGGVLLHAVGADGAIRGLLPESIKCQTVESGTGTLWALAGAGMPRFSGEAELRGNVPCYQPGGKLLTLTLPDGRLDPIGRDAPPEWQDVKGYRSAEDIENPVGEWNRLECVCAGDNLTVSLNGKVVNVAGRLSHTHGKIGLVSDGAEVFYRVIDLEPLDGFQKSQPANEPPWESLFDGKGLAGWHIRDGKGPRDWVVANGVLMTHGRDKDSWLMTDREFTDFELHLEYRTVAGTNSGVALRTPPGVNPTKGGLEIQILEDDGSNKHLRPEQLNGALFDIAPPAQPAANPPGQWNHMHVTSRGRRIAMELNGLQVLDVDLDKYESHSGKHPGLLRNKGQMGLQSHTNNCEFRELYIRALAGGKN